MEHKKYDELANAEEILALEKQTSKRYLFLAKFLQAYPKLEQECILTAFSMNPTIECFELVCDLAERCQQLIQDHMPKNESIDALHSITSSDVLLSSKEYDALQAPNRLLDSLTGLSEGVRSDLVCLLTMPRIKNLNWLLPWSELKCECESLLVEEKKRQIVEQTTAKANDSLKFINLNYEDYKDFTPHEYPGIETGYEIYVADSDSCESFTNAYVSDGEGGASTDTAPESKLYIRKVTQRLKARKRTLIRRSKKLLEQHENESLNIKEEPGTENKKRKRLTKSRTTDSLNPKKRTYRRVQNQKSGEENSQSEYPILDNFVMDTPNSGFTIKTEPIEIKTEIIDVKTEPADTFESQLESNGNGNDHYDNDNDDDMVRTFADLSNMPEFNSGNFLPIENFDHIESNECDLQEIGKENTFTDYRSADVFNKPHENFDELSHITFDTTNQCESVHMESVPMDNTELVNNLIPMESEHQTDSTFFPSLCIEPINDIIDNDDKSSIPFRNLFKCDDSDILVPHHELPNFADETINMLYQSVNTQPIATNEYECIDQKPIDNENFTNLNSNSNSNSINRPDVAVPYESSNINSVNIVNPVSNVTSSKPKNLKSLLAFRKPKKSITIKSNIEPTNGSLIDSTSTSTSAIQTANLLTTCSFANESVVKCIEPLTFTNHIDNVQNPGDAMYQYHPNDDVLDENRTMSTDHVSIYFAYL